MMPPTAVEMEREMNARGYTRGVEEPSVLPSEPISAVPYPVDVRPARGGPSFIRDIQTPEAPAPIEKAGLPFFPTPTEEEPTRKGVPLALLLGLGIVFLLIAQRGARKAEVKT